MGEATGKRESGFFAAPGSRKLSRKDNQRIDPKGMSMNSAKDSKSNSPQLRSAAIERVANAPPATFAALSTLSPEELLHDLQVHQVELEMLNESLRQAQIVLEEASDRFADFFEFAPVGYLTLTDKGLIENINLTAAELLGISRGKLIDRNFSNFVVAKDAFRWNAHFASALRQDDKLNCELALQRGDGSLSHVRLDSLRLLKPNHPGAVHITLTDISERFELIEALRSKEEFFRLIAESVDDFIAVLDLNGKRLYNSPSYARFFGDLGLMKGTDSFSEIHPDDLKRVEHAFAETIRSGKGHKLNFRFVLPDHSIRYMESCGTLIRNSQGMPQRIVVVSRDVTERMEKEDEIHNLAFYDSLTQLPNRRLLNDRLDQAMAVSKRSGRFGGLMFIDLDDFKPLNDMHGHSVGDLLLKEVARRISGCVRETDTVARFGGDEFVVVLSELDADRAESLAQSGNAAEKIRAILAEPYVLKFRQEDDTETTIEYRCTSSIGVVLFKNHEAGTEDILRWADRAMYQAKDAGRNAIRYHELKE